MTLKAPFPYYGGKRRWADIVWQRLGAVDVYSEPFAGTLALLLANPNPAKREVVCDTDGMICNFWRSIAFDFTTTAHWAYWPTVHQDLRARHVALVRWHEENKHRLIEDPYFCDAQMAGWWCWGISNWIGSGWCTTRTKTDGRPFIGNNGDGRGVQIQVDDRRPLMQTGGQGSGVQIQRENIPDVYDKRPDISGKGGARGVQIQRDTIPDIMPVMQASGHAKGVQIQREAYPHDSMPAMQPQGNANGIQIQRESWPQPIGDSRPHIGSQGVQIPKVKYDKLVNWFNYLAWRLSEVFVLNRSWQSGVTNTVLKDVATRKDQPTGIVLDPPYLTSDRHMIYQSDADATSDSVAVESFEWALEHGEKYRIAYFGHEGDFPMPDGWHGAKMSFGGIKVEERKKRMDYCWFSPACLQPENDEPKQMQESLF